MFFTTLASDPLNGPDQNPLNPAVWTPYFDPTEFGPLQILNHQCISTDVANNGDLAFYTGVDMPDDQWLEVKFQALATDGVIFLSVRLSEDLNLGYFCGFFNNGDGTVTAALTSQSGGVDATFVTPFAFGDVFRFAVLGNDLYVFQNGLQVGTVAADSSAAFGFPAITLYANDAVTDVAITNFGGGLVSNDVTLNPTAGCVYPGIYFGSSLKTAFVSNPENQDLLQVIIAGGKVVWNLTFDGIATVNPATSSQTALLGQFFASSFNAAFSTVFSNPQNLDVLQIQLPGAKVVFYVNYNGDAFTL
jgi:hypothetical protein